MYDSINPFDIPTSAPMVAGYVDGQYAWSDLGWRRFAGKPTVLITVTGNTLDAHVADVEAGDLTIEQGARWVKSMVDAGKQPYLYIRESFLPDLQAWLTSLGLDPYHSYGAWIASWDGVAELPSGWLMKQYANPTLSGGHYDLSIVADYLPGIDPAPQPPAPVPPPAPPPVPPPSPPPPANLDQARAAWAHLGELLITDFPGTVERVTAAIAKINALP